MLIIFGQFKIILVTAASPMHFLVRIDLLEEERYIPLQVSLTTESLLDST